jgi:N-acetylneuraminate synthase
LYTCFAAVALGARIIEKHIILDKLQPGPDQAVSIDMHDLHDLVDGIRKVEKASGNEKRVHHQEQQIRTWAFRSVVSTKPIGAGQTITEDMVWTKRPGTGIPSKKLSEVIGRTAVRDIQPNTLLRWEDLS